MSAPLLATLVSVSAVVLLTILFVYEHTRGARHFGRFRSYLDRNLQIRATSVQQTLPSIHHDVVRQSFYYLTHTLLALVLAIIRRFEYGVERVLKFNRAKAHRTHGNGQSNGGVHTAHLEEIAKHKEGAKLSAREQQKRRKEALEGK